MNKKIKEAVGYGQQSCNWPVSQNTISHPPIPHACCRTAAQDPEDARGDGERPGGSERALGGRPHQVANSFGRESGPFGVRLNHLSLNPKPVNVALRMSRRFARRPRKHVRPSKVSIRPSSHSRASAPRQSRYSDSNGQSQCKVLKTISPHTHCWLNNQLQSSLGVHICYFHCTACVAGRTPR